jgi:hypothetical protein
MALHYRWEKRARSGQTGAVSDWERSGYWQFQNQSAVARNFFHPPRRRAALRRAKFGFPTHPATARCRRFHQARFGALSTQFQTAPPFARGQIRKAARISAKCSGCGQKPARPREIRDSFYPARKPVLPMLPTTVETSRARDKRRKWHCDPINNGVLARRARTLPPRNARIVASYTLSGIRCVARYCCALYNT